MTLAEKLLLRLSRDPDANDRAVGVSSWAGKDPLRNLLASFPSLQAEVLGRDVLDFGCGFGHQSIALARLGAKSVLGVDIVRGCVEGAAVLGTECSDVASRVGFSEAVCEGATFDVIISQDSMEHFVDARGVLALWKNILRPGGCVLVTFGPPWLAPYGAHMHFFTPVPWVHLLFSEKTIMSARAKFRNDGATRYEDVEGGLARMTVAKFKRLVRDAGFVLETCSQTTVKDVPGASLPLLSEFITNNVSAQLRTRF